MCSRPKYSTLATVPDYNCIVFVNCSWGVLNVFLSVLQYILSITEDFTMGDKRKKVVVTMEEKLRAIQRLDYGVTAKNIASELGVGKSTVGTGKKIEQK
jgi:hypothetical protein